MPNLLKATAIGHLGGEPEMRYLPDGTPVTSFSVACNVGTKEKPATEWVRVTAWRKLAEICSQYLSKGKPVYVEGKLTSRSYEATNGERRFSMEITASEVQMLGTKDEASSPAGRAEPAEEIDDDSEIPF